MAVHDTFSFLALPPEICERVAQHASPQNLCNLRLVSKEVGARVFRAFTQKLFKERAFLMCSPESLRVLLQIAQSTVIAKHVKTIILCVDDIAHPDNHQSLEWVNQTSEMSSGVSSSELAFLRHCQQEAHKDAYDAQEQAIEADSIVQDLLLAFCRFRQQGIPLHVENTQLQILKWKGQTARHEQSLRGATGRSLTISGPGLAYRTAKVLDAIALSGVTVESLSSLFNGWGVPFYEMIRNAEDLNNISLVFKNLRRLDLETWPGDGVTKRDQKELAKALAQAPQLKALRLQVISWNRGHRLGEAFLELAFPSLRKLDLLCWALPFTKMIEFVRRQPKLRCLWLHVCGLMVDGKDVRLKQFNQEQLEEAFKEACDLRSCRLDVYSCFAVGMGHGRHAESDDGSDDGDDD